MTRPNDERGPALSTSESSTESEELATILDGCRAGNAAAFERLFELYKDYVYSVAYYLTKNEDLAADTVQDVFLKLFDRIDRFSGRSRWSTWLYRVVCNTVWDTQRRARPEVALDDTAEPVDAVAGEDGWTRLARRDSAQIVREAVLQLSPKLRTPLVLRYVAGLSYAEIAQVLGISLGTVGSRLSRAHDRLAEKVPRDKVEVP